MKVAASLICANLLCLETTVKTLEMAGVDTIHFDVMDGQFVPGFGLSEHLLKQLRTITQLPIEVHLMTVNPESHISRFIEAGANTVSVHIEGSVHIHRAVSLIREMGAAAGVVLNPATPVNTLTHLIGDIDLVTLMSIDPGLIGAEFLRGAVPKLRELRRLRDTSPIADFEIQVDGSVDAKLIRELATAGADIAVHGKRSIFEGSQPLDRALSEIRRETG